MVPKIAERFLPGHDVEIVGIYQRPVDIEKHCVQHLLGSLTKVSAGRTNFCSQYVGFVEQMSGPSTRYQQVCQLDPESRTPSALSASGTDAHSPEPKLERSKSAFPSAPCH